MGYLSKLSRLITVTPDTKIKDLKNDLVAEGLYLGYRPLDENHEELGYYLSRRVINLYHYKYGNLSDQVSTLTVEMKNGKMFHMPEVPRSAMGPDFNRLIIGGKENFGKIKDVTLKLVAVPERVVHGLIFTDSREMARRFFAKIMGQFILFLYARHFSGKACQELLSGLKVTNNCDDVFLFCLSGLSEMVTAEQTVINGLCQNQKQSCHWIDSKPGRDWINGQIHNVESYRDIKEQYRQFLWPSSETSDQAQMEKGFLVSHV